MIISGVFKLINQPTIRETKTGFKVCSLLLSSTYGRKQDGEKYRPTQLYMATLFGDRCETLLKLVQKQQSLFCIMSDVHVQKDLNTDPEKDPIISAVLDRFELLPGQKHQESSSEMEMSLQPRKRKSEPQLMLDDDIPF